MQEERGETEKTVFASLFYMVISLYAAWLLIGDCVESIQEFTEIGQCDILSKRTPWSGKEDNT